MAVERPVDGPAGSAARGAEGGPRLLIEDWLPVAALGVESVRERAAASALPPLYFLHVWWARRPLVASAAAVLGSVMPAWTPELAAHFPQHAEVQSEDAYRKWFLKLCGIWGDPVKARRMIDEANAVGKKLPGNGYGYKQAFKNSAPTEDVARLHEVLECAWGEVPSVLDPTAGGGSIPFEALRYGLSAQANELNPVAVAVLLAGVVATSDYGSDLQGSLQEWGETMVGRLRDRLVPLFPLEDPNERVVGYLYARTVACPRTGKAVPLAGDWWLRRGHKPVAVRLVTRRGGVELDEPAFEILDGRDALEGYDPKAAATWSRGKAVSPWDGQVIDGGYVRAEAQAGRMGDLLYAVAVRVGRTRRFRAPTGADLRGIAGAQAELERLMAVWESEGVLPDEPVPPGNDERPRLYGMPRWRDMFTPRQLLVHGCFVEEYRKLIPEVREACREDPERADAVLTLLAMIGGKAVDYNSRQAGWDVSRQKLAHAFSVHAFPFKKTFGEFEGGRELYPWCLSQMLDAYKGIAGLIDPGPQQTADLGTPQPVPRPAVTVTNANAANLVGVADESQTLVCIDPPYYDNVQYAELSDYFYVWHKRTLGRVLPYLFEAPLTNKVDEAVKNKARFAAVGHRAEEMAHDDYTLKMAAIFSECRRVLRRDGVMCVMFTHKAAGAWNALGTALLDAGFSIETSWPVRTESQSSLHQARQNSANSTVFLVCRKRPSHAGDGAAVRYLSDIEPELRTAVADAIAQARRNGLSGVDLVLATYGPALSVLSRCWPVHSTEAGEDGRSRRLEPEEALDIARSEVTRLVLARLVGSEAHFDPVTDFTILAWEIFGARTFPFDDARRLAYATGGLDVNRLQAQRIVRAAAGKVTLLAPEERRRGGVDLAAVTFGCQIDAVHTAVYVAGVDGLGTAKAWLDERGLRSDPGFKRCLGALARALPDTRTPKGEWNVAEAEVVHSLVSAYFGDIDLPKVAAIPDEELTLDFPEDGEVADGDCQEDGETPANRGD
jgi:adenine-specific DNA methylase